MTEHEFIRRLAERATQTAGGKLLPPATVRDIADAERELGFQLPSTYVRVLTEVANGGFGPGNGILGVPPSGYEDPDLGMPLIEAYRLGRAGADVAWRTPRGVLSLCSWGCGIYSELDCLSPGGRVFISEALASSVQYVETSSSLREWLERWMDGKLELADMYVVDGYRDGKNPFTGEAMQFPIRRLKGPVVDLRDRLDW